MSPGLGHGSYPKNMAPFIFASGSRRYGSGLLLALAITLSSYLLALLPGLKMLSPLLLALVLGMVAGNLKPLPASCRPGLGLASKTLLRLGVVLLGLRLSLPDIVRLGWAPLLVILVTVSCTYLITLGLGRRAKLPHSSTILIASGTAICGVSAIAGMAAVIKPRKGENLAAATATATACITLYGSICMFLLPPLAQALALNQQQTGVWLGSSIHEVGQVVGAAGFMGADIAAVASVSKLGRVVLLAPLGAIVGYWEAKTSSSDADRHLSSKRPAPIPGFVLAFLLAVVLRSALDWLHLSDDLAGLLKGASLLASFLLVLAMAAIGTGVNLKQLYATGITALALGALATLTAVIISLLLVLTMV